MTTAPGLALVIPTIERPLAVQRLVRSARHYLPGLHIYVGDQSHPDPFMEEFYRDYAVEVVRVPYDCGVSETRNRVVEQVREEFLFLCDDDFVFTGETRIEEALRILRAAHEVGVVGGRLRDAFTGRRPVRQVHRYYEMYLCLDRRNRALISFPIHLFAPEPEIIAGIKCYPCDALLNFAIFRREIFSETIRWDARFKSDGEHEDFYLNLKLNSNWRAVYVPTLVAEHERPPTSAYQRKRQRTGGWSLMMSKWGVDQYLEFGAGLRTNEDIDSFRPESELSKERFFASRRLGSEDVERVQPGAFEISPLSFRPMRSYAPSGKMLCDLTPRREPLELRETRLEFGSPSQSRERASRPNDAADPTIIVTTIDRPGAVQRFVRSVRRRFPSTRILVGDQSKPNDLMDAFYSQYGAEVIHLPYDAGLSATRNRLVERVDTDYFVLCDDDFIFEEETDFAAALAILQARREIGIVGGQVENIGEKSEPLGVVDWAMTIAIEPRSGLLAFVPLHFLAPLVDSVSGIQFYRCDAVANFAVFRRRIFDEGIMWDPRFRSDGEHEDFYLNLKMNADVEVAYLPSLVVKHQRPSTSAYERKRLRSDGWLKLMEKWGFKQYLEVGTGLRTTAMSNAIQPYRTLQRSRFYVNGKRRYQDSIVAPDGTFETTDDGMWPLHNYDIEGQSIFDGESRWSAIDASGSRSKSSL
jgi:glycosyltransferase involved in cell wall biosynthesis